MNDDLERWLKDVLLDFDATFSIYVDHTGRGTRRSAATPAPLSRSEACR